MRKVFPDTGLSAEHESVERGEIVRSVYRIFGCIGRGFLKKGWKVGGAVPIHNHNKNLGTSYHEHHIRVTRFNVCGTTIAIIESQQFHGSYPVLTI